MEKSKTYQRACKRCGAIHKTTSKVAGALCKKCNKSPNSEGYGEERLRKTILVAKISSLEQELIKLKTLPTEAWTAFTIGIKRMEVSLKERLEELTKELKSLNLKNASSGGND